MITKIMIRTAITALLISFPFLSGCEDGNNSTNGSINEPVNNEPINNDQIDEQKYKDITVNEAYTLIQENKENENFIILDVRTPDEFADGHLENAVNINFYSSTFQESIALLDKDKTYLVYCLSGYRSTLASEMIINLHFTDVYNMIGGIEEWLKNDLPTVQ